MRLNARRIIFSILFLFTINGSYFCIFAYADNMSWNGVIVTHDDYSIQEDIAQNSNNIWNINSYWQLPLWVQIAYILMMLLTLAAFAKALPFLFGRLKHVFDNPKNKEIYDHIQGNPGITISELSEEQGINRGTLKYHLSQLLANDKIMLIRTGKFSRLFYNNPRAVDRESLISRHLKNDKNKAFLFTIMDNPGITNQELSTRLGLDKSTVTDYLKKFMDDGLIEFRQDGKFKRCYLKHDARIIMLRYRPR